jgi:hypothetical protein
MSIHPGLATRRETARWYRAVLTCVAIAGCTHEIERPKADQGSDGDDVDAAESALTSTLFSDGFESSLSQWTISGTCARSTGAASVGSYGARCDDSAAITASINTIGMINIRVEYTRRTAYYSSGMYFYAEWSSNGTTWQNLEQSANDTTFRVRSFTLPAGANNLASLRLRFRANASGYYDRFDLDAVKVSGDSGSTSCTPSCGTAACGSDGCGGSCGSCGGAQACSGGACVCTPSCIGKTCGDNGCGGSCGTCGSGTSCSVGTCVASAPNPGTTGAYTICSYTSNLTDSRYASAIVSYPCEVAAGPFGATTLTGGYTNTKEDMYWLKDHVVRHGYIVIAITPNSIYGNTYGWRDAHRGGHAKLLAENNRSGSQIYGLLNTSRMQVMGFSKGGGGTLRAANELGTAIKTALPLAPWLESGSVGTAWTGIRAHTALFTSDNDSIASPSNVKTMYNNVPTTVKRSFVKFRGPSHGNWYGSDNSYRVRFKTQIVSWMKVYLDGNSAYQTYLNGAKQQENTAANWFAEYLYSP